MKLPTFSAILLIGYALVLTACATTALTADKALVVAVDSVDAAAVALDEAATSGTLAGPAAAKAKADLQTVQGYVVLAKAASAPFWSNAQSAWLI